MYIVSPCSLHIMFLLPTAHRMTYVYVLIRTLLTNTLIYQITFDGTFDVHLLPSLKNSERDKQRSIINAEAKI